MREVITDRIGGDVASDLQNTLPARRRRAASQKTDGSPKFWTVGQFCDLMGISKSTFYDWRAKGKGPECFPLPNGSLRIEHEDLMQWLRSRKTAA